MKGPRMRYPVMFGVLALGLAQPVGAQLRLVPLDIRVPKPPMAVEASGRVHLVYELRVTNIGRRGYAIQRVEVTAAGGSRGSANGGGAGANGPGAALGAWDGDSLKGIALRMGESGDGRIVGAGRQSLLYLHVATPVGSVPAALEHRILLTHADSLDGLPSDTLTGFAVPVDPTPPPTLQSPLQGGPWLAANGPGNTSGHRRTVIPLEGQGRVAQRFATDWIKLGPDGNGWRGDSTVNANWYGYGEPLLAVANGTVVAVKDGIIENVPFSPTMAVPITLETVGGNHVIIDIGKGRFAFYAHLVPGSLRVKLGDRVRAGQVIGLLGNSGNSTAPHLHFHLGDAPSPLGTEGIPFTVDQFTWLGQVRNLFRERWAPTSPSEARRKELPLDNHVVQFRAVRP